MLKKINHHLYMCITDKAAFYLREVIADSDSTRISTAGNGWQLTITTHGVETELALFITSIDGYNNRTSYNHKVWSLSEIIPAADAMIKKILT